MSRNDCGTMRKTHHDVLAGNALDKTYQSCVIKPEQRGRLGVGIAESNHIA
jgi:hypothetical protein